MQFTAEYTPDTIAAAGDHGLDDFESELARLMHQYTENPPADPLKQAQSDLSNVCVPARGRSI
jgi:vesicle-associated membrane protein 7